MNLLLFQFALLPPPLSCAMSPIHLDLLERGGRVAPLAALAEAPVMYVVDGVAGVARLVHAD